MVSVNDDLEVDTMPLTADAEARGTVAVRAAPLGGTLRAGVTRAVRRGGARGRALLVGELDDGEQRECLWGKEML